VTVEVSVNAGASWTRAQLNEPVLSKAQTRFQLDWTWDGQPAKILSRATDDKGYVQPSRQSVIDALGTNAVFHYNGQQTWNIDAKGMVRNVLA
jgi:sulfane dehydrogenase subunit SoxC